MEKQVAATKTKGVVGRTGIIIPMVPIPKQRKPIITKNMFFRFIVISPFIKLKK